MTEFRFVTPKRAGKWYKDLRAAQRFANSIGAGFLDHAGRFVAYCDTRLEKRERAS